MNEPLPLHPGAVPCIGCGFCCKRATCGFGEWDEERHRCKELVDDGDGTHRCARYEEILALPQEVWFVAPAFGAGCCSSLNPDRHRLVRAQAASDR